MTQKKNKNKRTIMVWAFAILLVVVLVFGTAPLVKYQLETNLTKTLGQPVTIEHLRLNVFRGQLGIEALKIGDSVRLQALSVDIEITPLTKRQVNIESVIFTGLTLPAVVRDGELDIAGLLPSAEESTEETTEQAEGESNWIVNAASVLVTDSEFALTIEGSDHSLAVEELSLGPISSSGGFEAELAVRALADGASVGIDGQVVTDADYSSSSFDLNVAAEDVQLSNYAPLVQQPGLVGQVNLDQKVSGRLSDGAPTVRATGDLALSSLALAEVVAVSSLNWSGNVALNETESYSVSGSLDVRETSIPELIRVESVAITNVELAPGAISADKLRVVGAESKLERDAEGNLVLPASFASGESADSDDAVAFNVNLSSVSLEQSQFEFIDRFVEPIVDLVLDDINAEVTNFSLTDSFGLTFKAQHHQSSDATLSIDGDYSLSNQSGDIAVNLSGFELHEIAPYMGNGIKSGRMKLESDIAMTDGHLKVDNDVLIRSVKIDERATSSSDQMSLSTALFMLKGTDDVIELSVPIETDLDNFEVGLSDIIQTAMLTAARSAAVAYAQYALQPYGTLLFAKDMFGAITKPKFEPVQFDAGSANFSSDDAAYVSKLGEFLADRPELSVTVCGYSQTSEVAILRAQEITSGEAEVSAETEQEISEPQGEVIPTDSEENQLKQLAEQRSLAVRVGLLSAGADERQLYGCTAAVEAKPGLARVELAL
jgi:hypothetical protein